MFTRTTPRGFALPVVILVLFLTVIGNYINGGIRTTGPAPHVTSQVKLQVSVLRGSYQ